MAKTIYEQTGWIRPYPFQILQDIKFLLNVFQFDYDLHAPGFIDYVSRRTGMVFSPNSIAILASHSLTKDQFLSTRREIGKHGADSLISTKTDKDLEVDWKIHRIIKAKIQDCWEIFELNKLKPQPFQLQLEENQPGCIR